MSSADDEHAACKLAVGIDKLCNGQRLDVMIPVLCSLLVDAQQRESGCNEREAVERVIDRFTTKLWHLARSLH
jgi:hypothetical protein